MKINSKTTKWLKLNWKNIQNFVSIQQKEIGVAFRNGDIATVKDLQRKLVLSFEARALAVRRVTTNNGSKTPGEKKKNTPKRYKQILIRTSKKQKKKICKADT